MSVCNRFARRAAAALVSGALCALSIAAASAATFPLPASGGDIVGKETSVVVGGQETLLDVARRQDLGYGEIVAANPGVDPWVPGSGTSVSLPTEFILPDPPRRGIVINLAQMRLYFFPSKKVDGKRVVMTFPLGIGREGALTPLGRTRVVRKKKGPSWFPPADLRKEREAEGDPLPREVPPGKDNPLGDYAMYLGMPEILIHGTNRPWGIGMRVSSGCIRLLPEDIEALFRAVRVGTPVRVVYDPYVLGRRDGALYVQVQPPLGDDVAHKRPDLSALIRSIVAKRHDNEQIDWDAVERAYDEARGIPVRITRP